MAPLPFAPRPAPREALSSWVARLAASNFVSADEFWYWLGFDPDGDLAPSRALTRRLAEVTEIRGSILSGRFAARSKRDNVIPRARPSGVRGAACPQCCYERQQAGLSHFAHQLSIFAFGVTCPVHRMRLVDLEGYEVELNGSITIFTRHRQASLGDIDRYPSRPGTVELKMEDALRRASCGRAPGTGWRTTDPGVFMESVNELADIVLWRGVGTTFASRFDDVRRGYGSPIFFLTSTAKAAGIELLADLPCHMRLNVISAIAALMLDPTIAVTSGRHKQSFRVGHDGDPFQNLVADFRPGEINEVIQRAERWPRCIAYPMFAAISVLSRR